jgi:hypothetical protein
MKKILISGMIAGAILSVLSYGWIYIAIKFFPGLFIEYYTPLYNSDGSRDTLFYLHAFIISFALAWFWDRSKSLFPGSALIRGFEFGVVYALVALLPVMWITFSALDVTVVMVLSWLVYGFTQAVIAGLVFARVNA